METQRNIGPVLFVLKGFICGDKVNYSKKEEERKIRAELNAIRYINTILDNLYEVDTNKKLKNKINKSSNK